MVPSKPWSHQCLWFSSSTVQNDLFTDAGRVKFQLQSTVQSLIHPAQHLSQYWWFTRLPVRDQEQVRKTTEEEQGVRGAQELFLSIVSGLFLFLFQKNSRRFKELLHKKAKTRLKLEHISFCFYFHLKSREIVRRVPSEATTLRWY